MPFSLSKAKSSPQIINSPSKRGNKENENRRLSVPNSNSKSKSSTALAVIPSNDNDVFDPKSIGRGVPDSPAIVNNTQYPIVVFLARGLIYNEAVLGPNEALICTRKQTGFHGLNLPYKVHAVIGDEKALPTKKDSLKNLAKVSIVPAAFVAGCLLTTSSAGTLAGPSAALGRLVSGMVIKGVVIDAASIAAGTMAADRARWVADKVLAEHGELFCGETGFLLPGRKYLSVEGGLSEGAVEIKSVSRRDYNKMDIVKKKTPITKNSPIPSDGAENAMEHQRQLAIGPGGAEDMLREVPEVDRKTFFVTIPKDIRPGMSFNVSAEGQKFKVTCPPNATPNSKVQIVVPIV